MKIIFELANAPFGAKSHIDAEIAFFLPYFSGGSRPFKKKTNEE